MSPSTDMICIRANNTAIVYSFNVLLRRIFRKRDTLRRIAKKNRNFQKIREELLIESKYINDKSIESMKISRSNLSRIKIVIFNIFLHRVLKTCKRSKSIKNESNQLF